LPINDTDTGLIWGSSVHLQEVRSSVNQFSEAIAADWAQIVPVLICFKALKPGS
jgi:hypothetical protein